VTSLKILHVNTESGFRGGEIQNLYLAAGLVARGHRCILAVADRSPLGQRAADQGLDVRQSPMHGEFDLAAARWLSRILHEERPHIVHYHTSHAVTLGTLARWNRRDPPTVATRRTSFPTRRNPLFRLKFTFRVDRVITVSGSIRDDLIAAGIPPARLTVVHSGIDLSRYEGGAGGEAFRKELGVGPEDLLVGSVGALAPQKGHRLLIAALAALAEEFPRLHLVLVGEGVLTGDLLAEARGLGLGDRVHLTGFREDVPAITSGFDVAALPSLAGEGSPAAVKEAMACGVPVVATDIGGVREILDDGVEGLVIPAGDAGALEGALRRTLQDPELRKGMARAGRTRARAFSMERMIERTEGVYGHLCGLGREPGCPG